jgi:Arc/MetJ-type ribon-helix-helix transcriptional regulator
MNIQLNPETEELIQAYIATGRFENIEDAVKANIIRYYTNEVHLRGLIQNQGFLTCEGRFCLCSRDF